MKDYPDLYQRTLTQQKPASGSRDATVPSQPRPSATPCTKHWLTPQTSAVCLLGKGIEGTVREQQRLVVEAWLVALRGEHLGEARERCGRRGLKCDERLAPSSRADPSDLVPSGRPPSAGPRDRRGEDAADQVVAPRRQGDRDLVSGPGGQACWAGRRRGRERPVSRRNSHVEQPLGDQPVQVVA